MGSETEDLRSNLRCNSPARPGAWPLRSICAFVLCLLSRFLERKQVGVVYSRSWCFSCFLSLSIEAMPQKICLHKTPIGILASEESFWAQVVIAKVSLITSFCTKKKARWHLIALFRCLSSHQERWLDAQRDLVSKYTCDGTPSVYTECVEHMIPHLTKLQLWQLTICHALTHIDSFKWLTLPSLWHGYQTSCVRAFRTLNHFV